MSRRGLTYLFLALAALVVGCSSLATRRAFYEPISAQLTAGRPDSAVAMIEAARQNKKYAEKDRLLYFLDAGYLNHYAGRFEASNQKLHLADAASEELFTKSISRAAASMVLNDNVLEYAGEDHEVLYANLISALNYAALGQFDAAFVEIRRANLKLEQLEQKYTDAARELERVSPDDTNRIKIDYDIEKVRFHNDAFARWLSMHMYAADGKWDDAEIDYSLMLAAFKEQPHIYPFTPPEVTYSSEGGILSVVALTGLAPIKDDLSLRLRTDKDLDLIQILYDSPDVENAEYAHFIAPIGEDFYYKLAIPQMVDRPSQVAAVEVLIDGEPVGRLELIEDIGLVARETFAAKKSMILIRTIIRSLAKMISTHKMKEKADTGGLGGWLKKAAIDVASELSENADLRSCQFLPGRIYVGDFELAPGRYDVRVQYISTDGHVLAEDHYPEYPVSSGGFNLISTNLPN